MAPVQFQVLITGDSRLKGLQCVITNKLLLHNIRDVKVCTLCFPGANLEALIMKTLDNIKDGRFDLIYIAAGVNDLSIKLKYKSIVPSFTNTYEAVTFLREKFERAKWLLNDKGKKVIICELIGLCYSLYNTDGTDYPDDQMILNNTIMTINQQIELINKRDKVKGPLIARHVHKVRHGQLGHRYQSTLNDGLHYSNATLAKVAKYFVDTFYINIHSTCN